MAGGSKQWDELTVNTVNALNDSLLFLHAKD